MKNASKIIETLKGILVKFKPVWTIFVKIMKFYWKVLVAAGRLGDKMGDNTLKRVRENNKNRRF